MRPRIEGVMMNLTLIAEILAGETTITPGGAVDKLTACGLEPFLWERWAVEVRDGTAPPPAVELLGSAQNPADLVEPVAR
ncbi:MAG TPA: hypothetical protein VG266_03270 [Candidatus Dormibacteraeota bacterium]|nr:hypothetical protein [Candidatus Dormibacteraeota bacterium]